MIRIAYTIPCVVGNASLRPKDAVNAIRSAIEMYEQTKPEFLTVIKIVIFETKLYSDFECLTTTETVVPVIETPPTFDTPSTSRYDQSSYLNPTPHRVKESIPRTMMLKLCSKHEQTNAKVNLCFLLVEKVVITKVLSSAYDSLQLDLAFMSNIFVQGTRKCVFMKSALTFSEEKPQYC